MLNDLKYETLLGEVETWTPSDDEIAITMPGKAP